jgi:ankyrin repeat protein
VRAVLAGHSGAVRALLAQKRIDPNLVDRDRQTALHWAALTGAEEIVRLLLDDSRTNAAITNRPDGHTAYEIARAAGDDRAAALLLERGRAEADELSAGDSYESREPAPPQRLRPHPPRQPRKPAP